MPSILVQAAQQEESKVIVLAKSGLGDAVAARAAAKLKASVVSGVTELPDVSNGFSSSTRNLYRKSLRHRGGKIRYQNTGGQEKCR